MSREHRRAFTLIELLVVVAIIALLIAILLPSLSSARDRAKNAVCLANLHAHGTAMFNYAAAWDGRFPNENPNVGGGLIMWDITKTMTDNQLAPTGMDGGGNLTQAVLIRKIYYCPLNPNQMQYWNYAGNDVYRIVGYYFLNNRKNTTLQALVPPKYPKTNTVPQGQVEDGELVCDVVMKKIGTQNWGPFDLGGGPGFTSSHMNKGKATGGNVLLINGSADWRPLAQMMRRYISIKGPPDDFEEWF